MQVDSFVSDTAGSVFAALISVEFGSAESQVYSGFTPCLASSPMISSSFLWSFAKPAAVSFIQLKESRICECSEDIYER